MNLKVSGPAIEPLVVQRLIDESSNPLGNDGLPTSEVFHSISADLRDGDLYIHIHLGWKAMLAFGLAVVPSIGTLIAQQNWLSF